MLCVQEKVRLAISEKNTHTYTYTERTTVHDEQTYDFLFYWEWEEIQHGIFRRMRIAHERTHTEVSYEIGDLRKSPEMKISSPNLDNSTRNMKNFQIHRKKSYKSAVNIFCVYVY